MTNIVPLQPKHPTPEELKQQVLAQIRANLQPGDQMFEVDPETYNHTIGRKP